jgi:hypothetical protein
MHVESERLGSTSSEYSSQRTYIVQVMYKCIQVQYLYMLSTLFYPNSYPMALTIQDRGAPKCLVERQFCLLLPFFVVGCGCLLCNIQILSPVTLTRFVTGIFDFLFNFNLSTVERDTSQACSSNNSCSQSSIIQMCSNRRLA